MQLARKYYPLRWPQIVDSAVELLHSSCELNSLLGAVEALRAVFSVFGNAVLGEIELSNLCNRTVLPLLTLASKLFQNFNAETGLILVSIFKLVGSAISFHLASVVKLNLHSLLMFVKKVLDLRAPLADPALPSLFLLKKTALRILFRLFQKHANPLFSPDPAFPPAFHAKYTRALVETLLLQVLPDPDPLPLAAHRQLELGRLALSCLAYANRQDSQAALLLAAHRIPFLQLCLTRFRLDFSRSFSGFPDFKLYVHENRAQLKEFLFSLLRSEALPDAQGEAVSSLLGLLCDCLQRPDPAMREVALYLFAEMSTEVDFLPRAIDEQLIQLIVTFAGPLLRGEQPTLVRARACQLLASYCELELPGECLLELAEGVYACLLTEGGDSEVFLRIYACNAFNSLLKYPSIVEFVRPHLPNILQLYTALLEADLSVLRNFEDLLNLLEEEVAPFANHLLRLLLRLFRTYAHREGQQSYSACGVEVDEEDEQEGEEEEEEQQTNVAKAVVSAVRQILQADATKLDSDVRQDLFEAVAAIFANPQQLFLEEGFNILNLLLYKQEEKIDPAHFLYFRAICWAVLGLPPSCLPSLASRHDPNSQLHLAILQNLCVEPDEDLLDNSVGCLRNFLSKSSSQVLRSCD